MKPSQAKAKREKRRRRRRSELPDHDPEEWLRAMFPGHFSKSFAPHHRTFWKWVWDLEKGERPRPIINVLPRKGGKSTSAEAACIAAGAPRGDEAPSRTYVLYVCGTQDQADDHVKTIASHLESSRVRYHYPKLARARVDQYGDRWGWNRQRLVTDSGLIIDAYGLMGASRGAKLEEYRPDLIVLDDIDDEADSIDVVRKKERRMQQQVIPAGSEDRAIMWIQNLVHRHSAIRRMLKEEEEWLMRRRVIGPVKAVEGLQYEQVWDEAVDRMVYEITGGTPTWEGFDLDDAEAEINEVGPTSFLIEYQHEVERRGGGIFDHLDYQRLTLKEAMAQTRFERTVVAVDPAISDNEGTSDCMAIQVDALGADDRVYRLWSWEKVASPEEALRVALRKAIQYNANRVVIETDQGGDTWTSVYKRAWKQLVEDDNFPAITENTRRPPYGTAKASRSNKSKTERGYEMLYDYETDGIRHVTGTHQTLERALDRAFVREPFDLADAAFWSWDRLRNKTGGQAHDIS